MPHMQPTSQSRRWAALILGDPQFWVPVVVLAAGLFVLVWIR